jgi:cathepsin B
MVSILPILTLAMLTICRGAYYEESFAKTYDEVRTRTTRWQVGYNKRFVGMSREDLLKLLGTRFDEPEDAPKKWMINREQVPDSFDARDNWPVCKDVIGFIRDQSACGSCWAVSSAEVMTDRTCIKSNGTAKVYISDEDILSCCPTCGFGCGGGWPIQAFKFWNNPGVVSGGPYGSKDGCRPYSIAPDAHSAATPKCVRQCQQGYPVAYPQDEHRGSTYFSIQGGAAGMQQEILKNGPIVACFNVYEDFYHYTSGVYHHVSGSFLGGHAVKVVGWGIEKNVPYWLVANSWNVTWGQQGYFKIQRANDECGFESQALAGLA